MSIYSELLKDVALPPFYRMQREFPTPALTDIPGAVRAELERTQLLERIKPGFRVAITAGSREIANYALILRTLCDCLKEAGALPFLFPAMGSHAGAIAEQQKQLLAHYDITEERMGVPILSSMNTIPLGKTDRDIPVYFDQYASGADAIIPVGRIKYHTCFRGEIESGLMKMLAIGCGKQKGASAMHERGFPDMSVNVAQTARVCLRSLPIVFGVGIVENANHQTMQVHAIAAEDIEQREKELLAVSKEQMVKLPFEKVDMLIVDEMGKNISGTGMDPNVTGRSSPLGVFEPFVEKLVVLDLTDESDGSAYGVGNADIITQRFYDKIILENMYPNGITNHDLKPMMIPVVMPSDRDAIRMAAGSLLKGGRPHSPKIVWIRNTLWLEELFFSEGLLEEARLVSNAAISSESSPLQFSEDGTLLSMECHLTAK